MFGLFEKKKADVIDHWYSLVPGFNTSTKEFYEALEKELKAREVPGLDISRVEFSEGGLLSNKREYLRMTRERLVFDVCAAPFGTAFFFSCRFAEIPAVIKLWPFIVLFIIAFIVVGSTLDHFGLFKGTIFTLIGLLVVIRLFRFALRDLDDFLIKDPTFGPIYERFFRKETYYRQDTRLMYLDTVNAVVKEAVEETTGAKGIKLMRFKEHSPILEELYKPTPASAKQSA